jgi:hypothetical protein
MPCAGKIREELKQLHPDGNAGESLTPEASLRFGTLTQALKELEAGPGTDLVVAQETLPSAPFVAGALQRLDQALQPDAVTVRIEQRKRLQGEARAELHSRFHFPRFGAASLAVVASGLWSFAGGLWFPAHPGQIIREEVPADTTILAVRADTIFQLPLFLRPESLYGRIAISLIQLVALYAWLVFVLSWFFEQEDNALIDWILTEEAQHDLLAKVARKRPASSEGLVLTQADLALEAETYFRFHKWSRFLGAPRVTPSFIEATARFHVNAMLSSGILERIPELALRERFRVSDLIARGLQVNA